MKRFSLYSLIILSAFNNILLCTTPWIPVEVRHVYEAAQRGDAALVEKNLEWHREHDKKKPVAMLEQARDMAVAHNDAKAAVFLTTRLKQEQMGSWEKYFRGITLVATIAAVTGAFIGVNIFLKREPSQKFNVSDISNVPTDAELLSEEQMTKLQQEEQAKRWALFQQNTKGLSQEEIDARTKLPGKWYRGPEYSYYLTFDEYNPTTPLSHQEALDTMLRRTRARN